MSPRLWVASLVPLFAAATAYAQAPGEFAQPPPSYGPAYTPYYAQPPVAPPAPQLPGRFSIGLAMHNTEFSSNDSGESATFGGAAIAIAYRPWRKVDLELSLGGGRQRADEQSMTYTPGDPNGYQPVSELAMGTGTLAARYHFNQEQHLNFWMLFGVGATTVARHDASDEEIDAAQRPHIAIGAGLEYRFERLAFTLEARALFLGQTEAEMTLIDQGAYAGEGISGGSLALGASYYFGR